MYFNIKQGLIFLYSPINVHYNMPITIGFFSWERINHFPFISCGEKSFGIRPVWYKSKDLERIKDVYRGTTVLLFAFRLLVSNHSDGIQLCPSSTQHA
jgi:hypothetical protein